jgi:hypothetical protein
MPGIAPSRSRGYRRLWAGGWNISRSSWPKSGSPHNMRVQRTRSPRLRSDRSLCSPLTRSALGA